MDKYISYITECRVGHFKDIINNSSPDHARALSESLVIYATEQKLPIRIISGSLHENFWSPITPFFEEYFKKNDPNIKLEIIILDNTKDSLNNNSVYKFLQKYTSPDNNGNTKVIIHGGIRDIIVTNQAHFILVGDSAYRKETTQNRSVAIASFNDPDNGKDLLDSFNFTREYINSPPESAHKAI